MEIADAIERTLLGESLRALANAHRAELLAQFGLDPDEADPATFRSETERFMRRFCREIAERHAGDRRVRVALQDWVERVDDYDAFDALLTAFDAFDGREAVVRRGRRLFPGPLTAHWEDS